MPPGVETPDSTPITNGSKDEMPPVNSSLSTSTPLTKSSIPPMP